MDIFKNMSDVTKKLEEKNSIPDEYVSVLKKRLVFICILDPSECMETRDKNERNANHRRKYSRTSYLNVCTDFPRLFISFIIAVSPSHCRYPSYFLRIREGLTNCRQLDPSEKIKEQFDDIAKEIKIYDTTIYKELRHCLFERDKQAPAPIAKTDFYFDTFEISNIGLIFGEKIYNAMKKAPKRIQEESELGETTHCVVIKYPWQNSMDVFVYLSIGHDGEMFQALFPTAWNEFTNQVIKHPQPYQFDNAYFTLKGASVSEIPRVFDHYIFNAVESSQLRRWETNHLLHETTDCVTLNISRKEPHECIIGLRVSFDEAIAMTSVLLPPHLLTLVPHLLTLVPPHQETSIRQPQ